MLGSGKNFFYSEIQHFSLGDGPGIRSTLFFKGCNLRCGWCHNPELISPDVQVLGKRTVGLPLALDTVFDELMSDKAYYERSGGGVTFSGGEPLLFTGFLQKLMPRLKGESIHMVIDTAGDVPFEYFEKIMPYTDLFYFDFKLNSREDYYKHTGGNYERIAENLRRLIERNGAVAARIPVIPGVNDSPEYNKKTAEILRDSGAKKVSLLPFHRLGAGKYKELGLSYAYADIIPPDPESLDVLAEIYREYKITVSVEK